MKVSHDLQTAPPHPSRSTTQTWVPVCTVQNCEFVLVVSADRFSENSWLENCDCGASSAWNVKYRCCVLWLNPAGSIWNPFMMATNESTPLGSRTKIHKPGHFRCADDCRSRFLLRQVDTYNVTLGRVRVTIVVLESSKYYIFWARVYGPPLYPCNSHCPYCHLRHVRLYYIFPRCLINGTIFGLGVGGGSYWTSNVFRFSLQLLLWNISHSNVGFRVKYPLFLSFSNDTLVFSTDFRKILW